MYIVNSSLFSRLETGLDKTDEKVSYVHVMVEYTAVNISFVLLQVIFIYIYLNIE